MSQPVRFPKARRLLTCLLAAALTLSGVPVAARAEVEDEPAIEAADESARTEGAEVDAAEDEAVLLEQDDQVVADDAASDVEFGVEDENPGGHGDGLQVPSVHDGNEGDDLTDQASLPASYDSNALGYLPSVRHQSYFGTCWAFGTIAAIEASMLKRGPSLGHTKDTLDLSE